jgi:DNA invertase Pin-like site-specific DNA recombinase
MSKATKRTATTKTDGTPRCFGYARVSTERQSNEGHSLADQESRIRGYTQSVGLKLDGVFVEAGVSGGKRFSARPKGAELLTVLRPGDHVISTKLDRCFRSACDALNVAEDFRNRGIHLHLLDIGGDVTGNGVAKLVFNILAAVAEMERGRISERVRSVKQHRRQAGYFTGGHVARGYNVTHDGKLVADDRWKQVLNAMKQMRGEGLTYRAIATEVSEQFGMTLDHSTIFRVLNGQREQDSVVTA